MMSEWAIAPQCFLTSPDALAQGFESGAFASEGSLAVVGAVADSYIACGEGSQYLAEQLDGYRICLKGGRKTRRKTYLDFGPRIAEGIRSTPQLFQKLIPRVRFQLQIFDPLATTAAQARAVLGKKSKPEIEYPGRYVIGENIGAGAFATVYSAFDRASLFDSTLPKTVAIKVFNKRPWTYVEKLKHWKKEVAVLERLRHPNIACLIDAGSNFQLAAGREEKLFDDPYIVMEHGGSRSVGTILVNEQTDFSWARAKPILLQLCSALEYLHGIGLIYRDIKSDHLHLETKGEKEIVKLVDFGLVLDLKNAAELAKDKGSRLGTLRYMSPEALRGKEVDPRSDIYSMGVLIYCMLTNYFPFGGSDKEIRAHHFFHHPISPRDARPDLDIPRGAEKIIFKAMSKYRRFRYQSMAEMAEAIERC